MNIDVTNTQEGGQGSVVKPEDFKANITPPKEAQVAVEPVAPAPVVETPVAQPQEQVPATPIQQPEVPVSPVINMSEPIAEPQHETPAPIDHTEYGGFDFSALGEVPAPEEEVEAPQTIESKEVDEDINHQLSAFESMDIPHNTEDNDTKPENLFIPKVSSPYTLTHAIEQGKEINKLAEIPSNEDLLHYGEAQFTNKAPVKPVKTKNLPDYKEFKAFHDTLPKNLQDLNFEESDYGNPDSYNLYGMWESVGKPKDFNEVKDGDFFPLQSDGTYHGFTVHNDTGEFLKPITHETVGKELYGAKYGNEQFFKENRVIVNANGRYQYVPNTMPVNNVGPVAQNFDYDFKTTNPNETIHHGEAQFPEGTFLGDLKNGLPINVGTLTSENGTHMVSEFKDGVPNNTVSITTPEKSNYVGGVVNGEKNGIGTTTTKNGKQETVISYKGKVVTTLAKEDNPNSFLEPFDTLDNKQYKINYKEGKVESLETDHTDFNGNVKSWAILNNISPVTADTEYLKTGMAVHPQQDKINAMEYDISTNKNIITKIDNAIPINRQKQLLKDKSAKLTPEEKSNLVQTLKETDLSFGADPRYKNLENKSSRELVYLASQQRKTFQETIDYNQREITKIKTPVAQQKDVDQQILDNHLKNCNKSKTVFSKINKPFAKDAISLIDYVNSPVHEQAIDKDLNSGDGLVDSKGYYARKQQVFNKWATDNKLPKGDLSATNPNYLKFQEQYGLRMDEYYNFKVKEGVRKNAKLSSPLSHVQNMVEADQDRVKSAVTEHISSTNNEVMPYYVNQMKEWENTNAPAFKEKIETIKKDYATVYQNSLSLLSEQNPQVKNLIETYREKIKASDNEAEKTELVKSLDNELSAIPEVKKLKDTHQEKLTDKLNESSNEFNVARLKFASENQKNALKDYNNIFTSKLKSTYKKTGYMAQYNAFTKADELSKSPAFKKATYEEKNDLIEKAWNDHKANVTKYFSQKYLHTPANENEKLNKHFTEWTGPVRERTKEDLAIRAQLLSPIAKDKFHVYATDDLLLANKPNVYQVKSIIQNELDKTNALIEYHSKLMSSTPNGEKRLNPIQNSELQKLMNTRNVLEKALDTDEKDDNGIGEFFGGLAQTSNIPFVGQLLNVIDNLDLRQSALRIAQGDIRREDVSLMKAKSLKDLTNALLPSSFATEIGGSVGGSLAYMAELYTGTGAITALENLTFKAAAKLTSKAATQAEKLGAMGVSQWLSNPTNINKVSNLTARLASVTPTVAKLPMFYGALTQNMYDEATPNVALALAGGYDKFIMKIEEATGTNMEALIKAYGTTALSNLIERTNLSTGIGNKVNDFLLDQASANKFIKNTLVGRWARKKGIDSYAKFSELLDNQIRYSPQPYIGGLGQEIKEELVDMVTSPFMQNYTESFQDTAEKVKEQMSSRNIALTGLSTALATAIFHGKAKIRIKTNDVNTQIISNNEKGEPVHSVLIPTEAYNVFREKLATNNFAITTFDNLCTNFNLNEEQKSALAGVFAKSSKQFQDSDEFFEVKKHIDEALGYPTSVDDIVGGDVTEVRQDFNKEENKGEELSPREASEQQEETKTETNDTENQTGIPSEIGRTEEPIQAEPNQETGGQATETGGMVQGSQEVIDKRNKELFPETSEFGRLVGKANVDATLSNYNEINGVGIAQYTNPDTGVVDVIMAATSDNDYVGYIRIYEDGKPTNRFTSKMENQSGNKSDLKTMLSEAQNALPEKHEYTESTSISTDGLRVYNQQLNHGYDLLRDNEGNLITNRVAINGDARENILGIDVNAGDFNNISVTNKAQFNAVKNALRPMLEKLGMNGRNIHWENGTVMIDLPVLRKTQNESQATETGGMVQGSQEELEIKRQQEIENAGIETGNKETSYFNQGLKEIRDDLVAKLHGKERAKAQKKLKLLANLNIPLLEISKKLKEEFGVSASSGKWGLQEITLNNINAKYDTEIQSLKTNESTTTTNTTTDGNVQPTVEQGTEAGTSEGVQPTVEPTASEGATEVKPIDKVLEKTTQEYEQRVNNETEKGNTEASLPNVEENVTKLSPVQEATTEANLDEIPMAEPIKKTEKTNKDVVINDNFNEIIEQLKKAGKITEKNCK